MEIRSIELWSAAKVLGTIYALIGLIIGILSALAALIRGVAGVGEGELLAGSIFVIILLPILYAIGGAIAGVLTAVLYNIVASVVGGLRINTR